MATILRPNRLGVDLKRPVNTGSISTMSSAQPQRATTAQQAPQQGRRYVNLKDWMDLNQDQAQKAAGQIGNRVEAQAQGAVKAQNQSRDQFATGVNAGSVSFDPNVRDSGAAAAQTGKTYNGPTDLSQTQNYADATQKTDTAIRDLGLSNRDLARQEWGQKGPYGAGEQNLDAVLLGQGNDRLQQLRDKYSGLSDQWSRSQQDATNIAGQAKTDSATAAAAYGPLSDQLFQKETADETQRQQKGADQWFQDQAAKNQGIPAAVQQAWIEAGKPALGPWLQANSPAAYKQYANQTGQTGSSSGLKGTPQK